MMRSIPQVKVLSSLIAAHSLADLVAADYELGAPVVGQLLRVSRNSVYLMTAGNQKYIARIYPTSQRITESHCRFELAWLNYLKGAGLPVSYPIQRRDGDYLGHLHAPEGLRYYTLSSFAEGQVPTPTSEEQSYRYGAGVAEIHLVSKAYKSPYERFSSDLDFLVDSPLQLIKRYLGDKERDELDFLLDLAEKSKKKVLETLGNDKSSDLWHIIGGDYHYGNVHFNEQNEPTFFDFDICSYGWLVYDIASFLLHAISVGLPPQIAPSFLAGYQSVRPLSQAELDSLLSFVIIRQIYLLGSPLRLGDFSGYLWFGEAWWTQNLKRFKQLQEVKL